MEEKKSIKIYPLAYGQNVWLFKVSGKTLITDKTYGHFIQSIQIIDIGQNVWLY